jgi:hypothetical protein
MHKQKQRTPFGWSEMEKKRMGRVPLVRCCDQGKDTESRKTTKGGQWEPAEILREIGRGAQGQSVGPFICKSTLQASLETDKRVKRIQAPLSWARAEVAL